VTDVRIRRATAADGAAISELLGQLGYPADASAIPGRLERMSGHERAAIFVAESRGKIVGLATAHVVTVLNRPRDVAWLTALVVDESSRAMGVGRGLVSAVEDFARQSGCERLSVTTHSDRMDARAFYPRIGLEETGRRFGKALTDEAPAPRRELAAFMSSSSAGETMWKPFCSLDFAIPVRLSLHAEASSSRHPGERIVLRIGTPLRLSILVGAVTRLTLLEFGSDGNIRVLSGGGAPTAVYEWPVGLMGPDGQPLQALVSGPPGIERFLAIATSATLPLAAPREGATFAELSVPEVVKLHRILQALPPAELGIAGLEFEVAD
jgi:GNAT superfamily N-acetyltransferase